MIILSQLKKMNYDDIMFIGVDYILNNKNEDYKEKKQYIANIFNNEYKKTIKSLICKKMLILDKMQNEIENDCDYDNLWKNLKDIKNYLEEYEILLYKAEKIYKISKKYMI